MIIGFAIGMFRLVLNVTIGKMAALVTEAEKLMVQVNAVTEYTRELLVANMQAFSDKIGTALGSGVAGSLQSSVNDAAASMAVISPVNKDHAVSLLSQASGSLERIFTDQYGFFFTIASWNGFNFTALLFLFCIVIVILISLFTTRPTEMQLNYTKYAETAADKAATRASWNKWDVIHTVIIISIIVAFYIYFW
jgi:hypothetical protein